MAVGSLKSDNGCDCVICPIFVNGVLVSIPSAFGLSLDLDDFSYIGRVCSDFFFCNMNPPSP